MSAQDVKHTYHLVEPSPWPAVGAFAALTTAVGAVLYMHEKPFGVVLLIVGFLLVPGTMFFWWRDVVREAVRTASIPVINMLVAAGTISIPGMMTGQLLAGNDPMSAARYQLFILFSIAGAVALGTIGVALLAPRLVFDRRGRLRTERIEERV